jgi:hypothetical protein
MRFLMKVELPVEQANAAVRANKLGSTIKAILDEQKPEAAYFTDSDGKRCGLLIVDMKDASQIPALAEPWFLAFNASIAFKPVMTAEDLAKAGPAIERAAKTYA